MANFTEDNYMVSENTGSIQVCVNVVGKIDRNVTLNLMASEASACKW